MEVAESTTGAFDLFDQQIRCFYFPVRCSGFVSGKNLGSPFSEGFPEGLKLGTGLVVTAKTDGLVELHDRFSTGFRKVDRTYFFFAMPSIEQFTFRVVRLEDSK